MPASRKRSSVEALRDRVTEICLALLEAQGSSRTGQHMKFTVREKTFAYFTNDHHGDGRIAISFKAPPGMQTSLVSAYPERFFVPSYLGPRGWIGLWIDGPKVDWGEVEMLLTESYCMAAPKRLAALVPEP